MRHFLFILTLILTVPAVAADFVPAGSWRNAKNLLDDNVYSVHRATFYCGCQYTSDQDNDGSGDIDADRCGLADVELQRHVRDTIQWEHVVPASLMPVGDYMCWQKEKEVQRCTREDGSVRYSNRQCCEYVSPSGKLMIHDLFNLVPSAAQLNQYRTNDPYGEVPDNVAYEGFGEQCGARDLNGTSSGREGLFEPPDCKKGDVARIWFYMRQAHGVEISPASEALFLHWAAADPVSPWERFRHDKIAEIQKNVNPYVDGVEPDAAGSCSWEPSSL